MLFQRFSGNPVLEPDKNLPFESECAYNPCAAVHNNTVYLIYRAEGKEHVSALCMAFGDGLNFRKFDGNPVIRPAMPEEKQGCEDPRICRIGDTFYLTYTAYDGMYPERSENIFTALATSKDLITWEKKGIILRGIKAAAIYPEKINGEYYMFVGGMKIFIATSKDLSNWKLEKKPILDVRKDRFDSRFVEAGASPFLYKGRLVMLFNTADTNGVFHPSLALLDAGDPHKVLFRSDEPLMTPKEDYELSGKVKNVIFGSGLIELNGKFHYYYGGADTCVALATVGKKKLFAYIDSVSV
jgi:predicted GH43/DUF377 family glycosyl hydrolase